MANAAHPDRQWRVVLVTRTGPEHTDWNIRELWVSPKVAPLSEAVTEALCAYQLDVVGPHLMDCAYIEVQEAYADPLPDSPEPWTEAYTIMQFGFTSLTHDPCTTPRPDWNSGSLYRT